MPPTVPESLKHCVSLGLRADLYFGQKQVVFTKLQSADERHRALKEESIKRHFSEVYFCPHLSWSSLTRCIVVVVKIPTFPVLKKTLLEFARGQQSRCEKATANARTSCQS